MRLRLVLAQQQGQQGLCSPLNQAMALGVAPRAASVANTCRALQLYTSDYCYAAALVSEDPLCILAKVEL